MNPDNPHSTAHDPQDAFEALLDASTLGTETVRQISRSLPNTVATHLSEHTTRSGPCTRCAPWNTPDEDEIHASGDQEELLLDADLTRILTKPGPGDETSPPAGPTANRTMVSSELHLRIIVSSESSLPVPASLRYDPADPYAVHATFHIGAEETVEWVFARDLLAEGLHRPAGTGDVSIWPSRSHDPGVVCIVLSSPEGKALLEAPARALESFLKRTDAVVPPGAEHLHVDVESLTDFLTHEA